MKQLMLIMLSILLVCCGNHNTKNSKNSSIVDIQEEQNSINLLDTISIEEYKIYRDSIYILSNDSFLSYPFGVYDNLKKINSIFTGNKKIKESEFGYLDSVYSNNNLLVFFFAKINTDTNYISSESGKVEIVYSKIVNSEIVFANEMRVGMSKDNFFKYFNLSLSASQKNDIKVVFFERGLAGVWQSYYFSENKLDSIILKTDYNFDYPAIADL